MGIHIAFFFQVNCFALLRGEVPKIAEQKRSLDALERKSYRPMASSSGAAGIHARIGVDNSSNLILGD
jgi:hypothetical protein